MHGVLCGDAGVFYLVPIIHMLVLVTGKVSKKDKQGKIMMLAVCLEIWCIFC